MASWSNLNFAPQHMVADNTRTIPPSVLPPPPPLPPILIGTPASIPPPPLPPPLQMGLPCQTYALPPPCNTSIPPPSILLYPPPVPSLVKFNIGENNKMNITENKFETFKEQLKKKYAEHDAVLLGNIPCKIKISTIKQKFVRCLNLIRQLEGQANCLQITYKSLPEEEWILRCKEIANIKAELSELLTSLDNPDSLKQMLKIISLRRKKMHYKKRKRKEWQEQKREAKLNSERENRRIDLWLEKMKFEVSRAKREEDIKREADMVLSDVTTRKAEAKRMLNLLNTLAKLRTARVQNLVGDQSKGDNGSEVFNKIIERLKKMWLEQIKGYNTEERGLKVMLEHAEEERMSVEVAEFRKNLKSWNRTIFGSSNTGLSQSFEEFIQIRHDWDKFIRTEDTLMASSIPIGWVVPSKPSSDEWKKLLT